MNESNQFLQVALSGNADERGQQHGHTLATRIEDTIEFYARLFAMREQEVAVLAKHFKAVISKFDQSYIIEIEALALSAKVDAFWIYALNSRTEILNQASLGARLKPGIPEFNGLECTAICFEKQGILGQNWDWSPVLENLAVHMSIEPEDGPSIKMITEPGILGKIGMNSEGLGVTLNILHSGKPTNGVPIHILLRAVLDSISVAQAKEKISQARPGRASNLMIATPSEGVMNIEFSGANSYETSTKNGMQVHTNHYLTKKAGLKGPMFASSMARYTRAWELLETLSEYDVENMQVILSDHAQNDKSICSHYHPHEIIGDVGTVFSLVMDLNERIFYLRKGNDISQPFINYPI